MPVTAEAYPSGGPPGVPSTVGVGRSEAPGEDAERRGKRSIAWARRRLFAYPTYVRAPDPAKLAGGRAGQTGRRGSYKKGWELRLVVPPERLDEVRALITAAGLPLAKPFVKGRTLVQPIYGYDAVLAYLETTGTRPEALAVARQRNGRGGRVRGRAEGIADR